MEQLDSFDSKFDSKFEDDMVHLNSFMDGIEHLAISDDDMERLDTSEDDKEHLVSSMDDMEHLDTNIDGMEHLDISEDDMENLQSSEDGMEHLDISGGAPESSTHRLWGLRDRARALGLEVGEEEEAMREREGRQGQDLEEEREERITACSTLIRWCVGKAVEEV